MNTMLSSNQPVRFAADILKRRNYKPKYFNNLCCKAVKGGRLSSSSIDIILAADTLNYLYQTVVGGFCVRT